MDRGHKKPVKNMDNEIAIPLGMMQIPDIIDYSFEKDRNMINPWIFS